MEQVKTYYIPPGQTSHWELAGKEMSIDKNLSKNSALFCIDSYFITQPGLEFTM